MGIKKVKAKMGKAVRPQVDKNTLKKMKKMLGIAKEMSKITSQTSKLAMKSLKLYGKILAIKNK